jgi:uncharacterized protein (TIGR02246 family)
VNTISPHNGSHMLRFPTVALLLVTAIGRLPAQDAATIIRTELDAIAVAWNNNDIERHVAPYADSATMMGSRGLIRGRNAVRDVLLRGFWRDGKALQQLRFDEVEVRMLGRGDAAVVTGRFILTGGGRDEVTGRFTTVWELRDGRWLTVHDHSG